MKNKDFINVIKIYKNNNPEREKSLEVGNIIKIESEYFYILEIINHYKSKTNLVLTQIKNYHSEYLVDLDEHFIYILGDICYKKVSDYIDVSNFI